MAERGLSNPEIATLLGVNQSTVYRFLERMKPEIGAVEAFKHNRADVLARIQAKSLDAQERIIDTLDDGLLTAFTPSQKSSMLIALNAQSGTLYDKERLERGQSTANISTISRMVDGQVSTLYKRAVTQPVVSEPEQNESENTGD